MKKMIMLLIVLSLIVLCYGTAVASEEEGQSTPRIVIDSETGAKAIIYDKNIDITWVKVDYVESSALEGNVGVFEAVSRSTSTPFTEYDWSNGSPYRFGGSATRSNLYSDYRFTGMIGCSLFVQNNMSADVLKVEFVKANSLFNVLEFEVQPQTGVMPVISGLDANAKYYFVVKPPSAFEGRLYPHFP